VVKLNKIYTRTGDDGTTGLVDGSRRAKHDARMVAIGDVDELNSALGLAVMALAPEMADEILRIQNDLFDLGADLATPLGAFDTPDFAPSEMVLRIVQSQVDWLEHAIDRHNEALPPLRSFILPGGSEAAASGACDRAACRARRYRLGSGRTGQPCSARLYQPAVGLPVRAGARDQCRRRSALGAGRLAQVTARA